MCWMSRGKDSPAAEASLFLLVCSLGVVFLGGGAYSLEAMWTMRSTTLLL